MRQVRAVVAASPFWTSANGAVVRRKVSTSSAPRKPRGGASWFFSSDAMPMQVSDPSSNQRSVGKPTDVATAESQDVAVGSSTSTDIAATVGSSSELASSSKKATPQTEIEIFLDAVRVEEENLRLKENSTIPFPKHPDELVPEFRRIKRHTKQMVIIPDPDYPTFPRKDQYVTLPPAKNHPWVEQTPCGPHVVHGDGQLGVVGTGEVGFDDSHMAESLPKTWRGLNHHSVLGHSLPNHNGRILDGDTVVKQSLALTGRGVFATRDIKSGEVIMVVASTAQNLGLSGEHDRLKDMCVEILKNAHAGSAEDKAFLHEWILTGQMSALVERWPQKDVDDVIQRIGGRQILNDLELHPIHVARLAAILNMNSFVVESTFDERRGTAYWPEAGFFNHSCDPNTTYEIVPNHMFKESEFYVDEAVRQEGQDQQEGKATTVDVDKTNNTSIPDETNAQKPTNVEDGTTSSNTTTVAVSQSSTNVLDFAEADLTPAGAPLYLFCSRAVRDIKAGEEILINYVPVEWTFDSRQYVLHDRYRFRCKCSRCAPTLDSKYAMLPRFMLLVMCFLLTLQIWVIHMKYRQHYSDDDGADPSGETPKRFFDLLKLSAKNSLDEANYDLGQRSKMPAHIVDNDPMMKLAR